MGIEEIKLLVIIILGLLALRLQTRSKKPAVAPQQVDGNEQQQIIENDENVILKRQQQIDKFINQMSKHKNSIFKEALQKYLLLHKDLKNIYTNFQPSQPNFQKATFGNYQQDIFSDRNIKYKPFEQTKVFPTFNNTQSYYFNDPTLFNTPVQFNQIMEVQEVQKDSKEQIKKVPEKQKMISKELNKQMKQKNIKKRHNRLSYLRNFSKLVTPTIMKKQQSQSYKKNKKNKPKHKLDKDSKKLQQLEYEEADKKIQQLQYKHEKVIRKDEKGNILEIAFRFKAAS